MFFFIYFLWWLLAIAVGNEISREKKGQTKRPVRSSYSNTKSYASFLQERDTYDERILITMRTTRPIMIWQTETIFLMTLLMIIVLTMPRLQTMQTWAIQTSKQQNIMPATRNVFMNPDERKSA